MAKDSIFAHRIAGPLMRGMHHIPVDREAGSASFRDGLSALREGEIVGIFPEATISRSFEPKEFKSGAERHGSSCEGAGDTSCTLGNAAPVDLRRAIQPQAARRPHPSLCRRAD